MHPSLGSVDHRPWPLPARRWSWRQTWHDLLFLHWPIPASALRPIIPEPLEIQQFAGTAWVGVIPFWMSDVTLRGWPPMPLLSRFPEMNVRTYVNLGDRPGVWFFSLDAANRLAVWTARRFFHLPYIYARMQARPADNDVAYSSMRSSGHGFEATYGPRSKPYRTTPDTLENWLTERYCLYAQSPNGQMYRADIHHEPWPLQHAEADVHRNDMLSVHKLSVNGPAPEVHFARRLDVVVWSPTRADI